MAEAIDRDDPVKSILELDASVGKFEVNDDGYIKFVPSAEELERLNLSFGERIAQTQEDHKESFDQIHRNIEAYRGKGVTLKDGGKPVLTPYIIGRQIDQMVAHETVRVMQPRPIVSFDPFFRAQYSVPIEESDPEALAMMGAQAPVPMQVEYDAEDVAAAWAAGFDFKLREKLRGRELFRNIFKDIHVAGYSIVKNPYERTTRTVTTKEYKKNPKGWIDVVGEREWQVLDGEPNQLRRVSQFAFLMPMDADDVQHAEWVSEDVPEDASTFREKLKSEYTLIPKDQWNEVVGAMTDKWRPEAEAEIRSAIDKRRATRPRMMHDIKEVWFFHPVTVKEPTAEGEERKVVRVMSFMGAYHFGLKRFLCIYRNPYHHGKRPYEVFFEDEEAGRHASASTVERVAQGQKLVGQMLHITLQCAVKAATNAFWADPDGPAWDIVSGPDGIGPDTVIPGKNDEDFGVIELGRNHGGLMNEIGFVMNDITESTGQDKYRMGNSIPNRTAASTVSQILEAGYLRPTLTIQSVSDGFARLVRMWLETQRQYQPLGEMVPTRDPETNALIEVPFRFPMEPVFDNFRIALTAADEELAKEVDTAETIQMAGVMAESGQRCAQILGAIADPNTSPAMASALEDLLQIEIGFQKMLMKNKRTDVGKFSLDKERVVALLQEKEQAMMMMEQQQAMMQQQQMQQGGMGGGGSEAAVPGGGGPEPGAMGPMA